jgi:2,3-bisphosphoglycerate-independent phosphoglycerate mutase
MNEFTRLSYEKLSRCEANLKRAEKGLKSANIMLARGAGYFEKVEPFEKRFGMKAVCVAAGALYRGVARYVGMDLVDVPGATGTTETNLAAKAGACLDARAHYQFIFCHIKGTDACGHDGQFDKKKAFIERVDAEFVSLVEGKFDVIIFTGDHSTPVTAKRHSADPTPFVFYHADCRADDCRRFTEADCAHGGLGVLQGIHVVPLVQDYLDVAHMFGE